MSVRSNRGLMPTSVTPDTTRFDRFAGATSRLVSRGWFFTACVTLIVGWLASYPLFGDVNTWQLLINTATTAITFLLVALLQNAQRRADQATQHKLNAIAAGLAALMLERSRPDEPGVRTAARIAHQRRELIAAIGLEERESA